MEVLTSTFLSGLVLASLYALMASGLSLIWTTLGVFNFAHGALMMIGAFVAWTISEALGLGLLAGLIGGVAFTALCGVIIEILLVRPFYSNRNMVLITVMTTLAAMIVLEKGAQMIWGARLKQLPRLLEGDIKLFGAVISAHEAMLIVLAPTLLVALWLFASKTSVGRSLRAVGQNKDAAALLGINVPVTFGLAFGIGAGLAGLSGILLGGIRFITPSMGAEPLVKAMIVVIFGGLGSLGATVGAALVLGMAEAFLILYVGLYWTPFIIFLGLIAVLILRPNGLFSRE